MSYRKKTRTSKEHVKPSPTTIVLEKAYGGAVKEVERDVPIAVKLRDLQKEINGAFSSASSLPDPVDLLAVNGNDPQPGTSSASPVYNWSFEPEAGIVDAWNIGEIHDAYNTERDKRISKLCVLCGLRLYPEQWKRMPIKMEKVQKILDHFGASEEQCKQAIERATKGISSAICPNHVPVERWERGANLQAKVIFQYRSRCFICGKSRHSFELFQIPTSVDDMFTFLNFSQVDEKLRDKIRDRISDGIATRVCIAHFPPGFTRRDVRSDADPFLVDEKGRKVRVAEKGSKSYASIQKKSKREKELRAEGRMYKRCHWCRQSRRISEMRRMPSYPKAIEAFFEFANGTPEQVKELRERLEKTAARNCRACYDHFPEEWRYATGRYWYTKYFGDGHVKTLRKKERKKKRDEMEEKRIDRLEQMEREREMAMLDSSMFDLDNSAYNMLMQPFATFGSPDPIEGYETVAGTSERRGSDYDFFAQDRDHLLRDDYPGFDVPDPDRGVLLFPDDYDDINSEFLLTGMPDLDDERDAPGEIHSTASKQYENNECPKTRCDIR